MDESEDCQEGEGSPRPAQQGEHRRLGVDEGRVVRADGVAVRTLAVEVPVSV